MGIASRSWRQGIALTSHQFVVNFAFIPFYVCSREAFKSPQLNIFTFFFVFIIFF